MMMDVAIIGGGPAGISAALTLRQRGKDVVIISADPEQSHLAKAEKINNYPGMTGMNGTKMLRVMTEQAEASGAFFMHGRATSIMNLGESFGIAVGSEFVEAEAVILTLGISMGKPYKGETAFLGRGVSYCATCDGMLYRNKKVAVIGLCADAAEEAEFLKNIGCDVEYFDRTRAKSYEIRGEATVNLLIADGEEYPVDGIFILRSGVAPDLLMFGLELQNGAIAVDRSMRTNLPGIFAAGDCTGLPYQLPKAVGEGNIAALSAVKYLDTVEKE